MTGPEGEAQEAIRRCRELREGGAVEAVLRGEIHSRLRLIFPGTKNESWINHYGAGAEAATKVGMAGGVVANRFIDNLVGATTIEYEPDLRIAAKRAEGFNQVREHVAGLARSGVPLSQIRGVLSDTVEWHIYDARLREGVEATKCTSADIALDEIANLHLETADAATAARFVAFIKKHLAREQSRPLHSHYLTLDLGLESGFYSRSAADLRKLVDQGRKTFSAATVATDLWSHFIDYLEGDAGGFRAAAYVDEVYLCVVGRLLIANILAGQAKASDDTELVSILDGTHFRSNYQLANMVEADYFGWLIAPNRVTALVPVARNIQHDLYVYDYSWQPEQDLFGRLMAQLSRRSQRKLLGQEWTPPWLSRLLAHRCLAMLPKNEKPRFIDMCCGSGAILAEIIKVAREAGWKGIDDLHDVATGFDIDPLAVSLAKATWVITLANEIKAATAPVEIPIYNADSLFAVTPVTPFVPFFGDADTIDVTLDGVTIKLPEPLFRPEYHDLFDKIIDWAYDEAIEAQADPHVKSLTREAVETFLDGALEATDITLPTEIKTPLIPAILFLAERMVALAKAGRNGIWAFILRNTYRPALLSGQFNGLVSNPPWLAMSRLADNPYKDVLDKRASLYGVRPSAQSFLHLELGTTHLLHAVDRYLAPKAAVACLVPGTIFNGTHHEPFRRSAFRTAKRPVAFDVEAVWQVEAGTFKYPGAAIIGRKRAKSKAAAATGDVSGFLANQSGLEKTDFSVRAIGTKRTAWVLEKDGQPVATSPDSDIPQQGADLMPRTAVCIDILSKTGAEYRVDTPGPGTPFGFTVKAAKEFKTAKFPGYVARRFIYRMAQSENLLPFVLGEQCATIALPATRTAGGWTFYDDADIRRIGFVETARRFKKINATIGGNDPDKMLHSRIDVRGKLSKQTLSDSGFLLLAGAGGKHICAACIPVSEATDLVIDQTLYWRVIPTETAAWYHVGMLNSPALTEVIMPFNPKGAFKERHIHSLPYRMMPRYDPANEDHRRIAVLAKQVSKFAAKAQKGNAYLSDATKGLVQRRTKMRKLLPSSAAAMEMFAICAALLAVTPHGDEDEDC